jgi:predicted porin
MLSRSGRTAILCAMAAGLGLPGGARAEEGSPLQWKLYGFLNAQVEQVGASGGPTEFGARSRLSDGNSRIGFAGSYAVGDTTRALWQLEGSLNAFEQGGVNDKGISAVLVSRNTFVGVEDARIGRLILGTSDSAYRSLVGSAGELGGNIGLTVLGLDLWNNTSAQMTGNPDSVFSRGEARYKNSLHYLSPDWIVQGGLSYGIDEAVANGRRRDRIAAAVRLKTSGFQLGAGLDYQGHTGANADQLQQGLGLRLDGEPGVGTYYYKVVASYTAPVGTFLGLGWERSNYGYSRFIPASVSDPVGRTVTGTMRQDSFMVSLAQPFGRATVMGSVAFLGGLQSAIFSRPADYEATQFSLGAKYDFNEHFALYAYGTSIRNGAQQNVNLGQAPLYSNGAGTADAFLAPGDDPHAVGVGLITRFF